MSEVPVDSSAGPQTTAPDAPADIKAQADKLVAEGKKAIALKDWEEGVEKYGEALALM
jgi:HAT1-interacting factor 1